MKTTKNPSSKELPKMTLHIYTTRKQPAIKYRDPYIKRWFGHPRKCKLFAACCMKFRNAESLMVQVYYDALRYSCADGKGCKEKRRLL